MATYLNITFPDSDLNIYSNWRLLVNNVEKISYTISKVNRTTQVQVPFTSDCVLILEAQSNWLSPYPNLKNKSDTLIGNFEMGGSSMELEYTITSSDFNKLPTISLAGNQIKEIFIRDLKYVIQSTPVISLQYNLENCVVTPNISEYTANGETQILTITPNSGYHIDTPPTITDDENFLHNFTQGENGVWTFDLSNINVTDDVTAVVTANAVAYPIITLSYNASNCTVSPSNTSVVMDGNPHIITITPNSDYSIDTPPTISNGSQTFNFSKNGNSWTFDLNTLGITTSETWSVTAIAVNEKTVTIDYQLTNAVKSDDSAITWDNGTLDPPDIIITPNSGYTFNTPPTVTIVKKDGSQNTYPFEYNQGLDAWTSSIPVIPATPIVTSITVYANAVEKTQPQEQYAFLKLYSMTEATMQDLASKRFIQNTANDTYIDIGQYILNVFRYPFTLSTGDDTSIVLGAYNTNISTKLINETEYTFISDPIRITGLYDNASDVLHSNIRIFLPYHGYETISSEYINTEIQIEITVEVMTNNCIYKILSDNRIVATFNDSIADQLPYILKGDNMIVQGETSINITPNEMFIEIEQKPMVNGFILQTNKHLNSLDGINGYIQTQNYAIKNNQSNDTFTRTKAEEILICEAMNNGVYLQPSL